MESIQKKELMSVLLYMCLRELCTYLLERVKLLWLNVPNKWVNKQINRKHFKTLIELERDRDIIEIHVLDPFVVKLKRPIDVL